MKDFLKIVRSVLIFMLIVFMFFKWLYYDASSGDYSTGFSINGFMMIGQTFISLLLFVIPAVFIGTFFVPFLSEHKKALYPIGSIIGIAITMILGWIVPKFLTAVSMSDTTEKCRWGSGLWLTIFDYIAIFIISAIIDYNISKDTIKENGVQAVVTNTKNEMKETVSSFIDEVNTKK